jgi:membrane protein YdbS with pleckstrin-like domain
MDQEKKNKLNQIAVFVGKVDSALLLTFFLFKCLYIIDWSWWWVLSPLWIFVGIIVLWFIFVVVVSNI